jgi:hypothetical protein
MPISACYLFKNSFEFLPASALNTVPVRVRGLYVLYKANGRHMDVVYVGMARGDKTGVRGRLLVHKRKKAKLWSHFSVYEVWDNITKEQVEELEGLFRHLYRHDAAANRLNVQKSYRPLNAIRRRSAAQWQ